MSNDSSPTQPERPEPRLPQFDPHSTGAPAQSAAGPDETQVLPTAPTARTPIVPPAAPYTYAAGAVPEGSPAPQGQPSPYAVWPASAAGATPAVAGGQAGTGSGSAIPRSPRWSAKKTAITAGLVLVLTAGGAIAAAAALPSGSTAESGRFGGPGQGRHFQFPGGQGQQGQGQFGQGQQGQGQQGQGQQVLPNQPGQQGGQLPGGPRDDDSDGDGARGLGGIDPNQLLQMSPDQLLQLLDEQGQLGSGGSGQLDPFGQGQGGQGLPGIPGQGGTTSQGGTSRTT